jgi:hypothetical protein
MKVWFLVLTLITPGAGEQQVVIRTDDQAACEKLRNEFMYATQTLPERELIEIDMRECIEKDLSK